MFHPLFGKMSVQVTTREVQLGDHVTSVLEAAGAGCPLILIHAAAMDKKFWNFCIIEHVAASTNEHGQQRRIIAYDLRGHGRG